MLGLPTDYYTGDRYGFSKRPVCGVMATAVASKQTFEDVFNLYAARRHGRWKGSLSIPAITSMCVALGVKKEEVKKYSGHRLVDVCFDLSLCDSQTNYVVFTKTHVMVVRGRTVMDQSGEKDVMKTQFFRRKLTKVYRITDVDYQKGCDFINEQRVNFKVKKEVKMAKLTKIKRARVIYKQLIDEGKSRKEIISELSSQLDSSWESASMFFHKVKNEFKAIAEEKETA